MIKIENYRIDEEQVIAYFSNYTEYIKPALIIDMKDKMRYAILCETKNKVESYLEELDDYFDVNEIVVEEETFIN